MAPIISRLSSLGGGGTGGFTFGKRKVPAAGGSSITFSLIFANSSSNNILIYDGTTDTFSSRTLGSSGTIRQLHYNTSGFIAIAGGDGSNSTVYQSSDNGNSWSSISTVGFSNINESRYASRSGEPIILSQAGYDPPVRRSTDGGASWSANITLPGFAGYGALGTSSRSNGNWYYSGRYQGGYDIGAMWRSTDNGVSWTRVATFGNDQTNGKVAYSSGSSRYICANYAFGGYSYQKPVYSSNGTSWTNPGNGSGELFTIRSDVDSSPTSYIGVNGTAAIYRSTDGLNWTSIDLSYLSGLTNHSCVVYDATLGYYFVMGTSYFLFSDDDGLTWSQKSTVIAGNYSSVAPLIIV